MQEIKTILCYGDSNTWGFVPGSLVLETFYMQRYPHDERWTGILQKLLGPNYCVVEEGLNGRTTNVDYMDINRAGRNGKTFLPVCLYSHAPLDLVILMLGSNDLKVEFNRKSDEIAKGVSELLTIIKTSTFGCDMQQAPQILLINPPCFVHERGLDGDFKGALKRNQGLDARLKDLARENNCFFFDVAPHIKLSEIDGVHLDREGHRIFAKLIAKKIAEDIFV